jgi:hypothetical protein
MGTFSTSIREIPATRTNSDPRRYILEVSGGGSLAECEVMSDRINKPKDYESLIKKLDEYIKFISKGAVFEAVHGGCSSKDFEKGEKLREEIKSLRKAI